VAAYRADIEIGVRGARSLEQLRSSINQTARAVDSLNDVVSARGSLVQNIQNYTNNLNRAAQSLRLVGAGTEAETKAVREYVRALGEANAARARQNSLVAQELANQRRVTPGNAGYGQQGPALPPAVIRGQQIQQNWSRFFAEASQIAQELQGTSAAKGANIKSSWNRFFTEAAQVAQEIQSVSTAKQINVKTSWQRFFAQAQEVAVELTIQAQKTAAAIRSSEGLASAGARQRLANEAARRQLIQNAGFGIQGPALPPTAAGGTRAAGRGIGGRLGGAISGSIIGGAFPLLFGQGGGAAAGGAIGGLVGGLAGPGGSFAGSLLGTLLGDIASRGQAVKQLADDIGFSAQQTKQLSDAFKVANTDVEKFTAVIQNIRGVGLEIEDQAKAIQLVTRLTELYGGSFEKTGNAITSALEAGKVTQATLNQLTSQGINIQQALADKYGVSRSEILKMAKDGDVSVQALIDTLVKMGNEGVIAVDKPRTAMDRLKASVNDLGKNLAGLANALAKSFGPVLQWLTDRVTDFVSAVSRAIARMADLINGGRMAQAEIQASAAAQTATRNKFGPLGSIRAINPAAEKFYQQQRQVQLRRLTPGAFAQLGPRTPLQTFAVPSQAADTAAGAKGPKPPADRTAQLMEDLDAMKLISVTQDGIRDALFEGNKELAIRLEYDQKVADINRDTAKAILNANYESEKAVLRAQEIVRLKDAQLERDDQLRDLAREISEIITNTLDDLRGGISWDDTGLRDIFDMRLPDAVNEINENINQLIDPANRIIGAATAIGDAFAASFSGIASGAMTAREGLSNFFRSVGQYFIDMAATIAAEALKLQAISLLQGIFSKFLNPFGVGSMSLPGLQGTGALSTGPLFPGGAFAEGGFVTGPTRALIGEGGQSEYVIPASKMRGAMSRYSAGARGSAVIPSGSDTEGNGTATMAPASIDVRYTVERINSVDYVTADQFQSGLQQAAAQGAERGQQLALRRLQQSPSTRRRVGI